MTKSEKFDNGNSFYFDSNWNEYVLRNRYGVLLESFRKSYVDNLSDSQYKSLLEIFINDNR